MGVLRPLRQRIAVARMQGIAARHSPLCAAELDSGRHGDAVKAAVAEIRAAIDDLDPALLPDLLDEAAAANVNDHHEPYKRRHQLLVAAGADPKRAMRIKQRRGRGGYLPHEPGS